MLFFLNLFIQKKFNRMIHDCLMNDKYLKLLFRCAKAHDIQPLWRGFVSEVWWPHCGEQLPLFCFSALKLEWKLGERVLLKKKETL